MTDPLAKSFADLADGVLSGCLRLEEFYRKLSEQATQTAETIGKIKSDFQADAIRMQTILSKFSNLAKCSDSVRKLAEFVEADRFFLETAGHGDLLDVVRDPDTPLEKLIVTLDRLARIVIAEHPTSSKEEF